MAHCYGYVPEQVYPEFVRLLLSGWKNGGGGGVGGGGKDIGEWAR